MTILVTAYRWGWLNNHQYIVYCGDDEQLAEEMAEQECDDRGGKYGVAVRHYCEDGDYSRLMSYHKSSWGENLPYHNYRLDYISRLGHMLEDYIRENPTHELAEKVETQKVFYDALQKAVDNNGTNE